MFFLLINLRQWIILNTQTNVLVFSVKKFKFSCKSNVVTTTRITFYTPRFSVETRIDNSSRYNLFVLYIVQMTILVSMRSLSTIKHNYLYRVIIQIETQKIENVMFNPWLEILSIQLYCFTYSSEIQVTGQSYGRSIYRIILTIMFLTVSNKIIISIRIPLVQYLIRGQSLSSFR